MNAREREREKEKEEERESHEREGTTTGKTKNRMERLLDWRTEEIELVLIASSFFLK